MPYAELGPGPTIAVALPAHAVDMVPLGIVKIDHEGRFTYANRTMLQIAGLEDWRGRTLADVFRGKNLETVRDQLKSRFERQSANEYTVDLTHVTGKEIPLSITAFPETNERDDVVGALALVRDLTVERAQQQMYKLVEQESENDKLLDAIANTLRPLIPFDRLQVIRFNKERSHLRTIYPRLLEAGASARTHRWWQIPDPVKYLLKNTAPLIINDLPVWYRNPERRFMLGNPAVRQFLAEGFVATMSLPVGQNNEQVASIVLSRKQGSPFTDQEREIADALPLTEAVSVALRNETEGNLTFLLELMKDISSAYGSVRTVAQSIVEKISEHYGWDYVSIYQVYEKRGKAGEIHLIAQKARRPELLSNRESFHLTEGIVGYVFHEKKGVNIGDLWNDKKFKPIAIRHRNVITKSQVCVPVGPDSRWLLNVEDKLTNAFAREEMRDLEAIAAGLSALLKRTLEFHYRSAIFSRANDAILLVDERGMILEVNAATETLLRIPKSQIENQPVEEFFVDAEDAKALMIGASFENDEVRMRVGTLDGSQRDEVKVLLSVALLPEETGGKIFVASDMTQVQRVAQLELAQDLYKEVTGQVKTPMSLGLSWLRRHADRNELGPDDVTRKVIQQLQKAELTLDRLMLTEPGGANEVRHEVPISIDDLVEGIKLDMPAADREAVVIDGGAEGAYVRGDAYELRYCLQTVLSYLLRNAAEVDRIVLNVRRAGNEVELVARGRAGARGVAADLDAACRSGQVRAEMSLGSETLARLARRNRGQYTAAVSPNEDRVSFSFTFPVDPGVAP
jgi:PAS domain S-box-containing protein